MVVGQGGTILVTDDGVEILTVPASGEPAEFRFAGAPVGAESAGPDTPAPTA